MYFRQLLEPNLAQYSYLIGCQRTGEAIVIDPMRDIDRYRTLAKQEGLRIVAVAETHIHADFLSGARQFAHEDGVRVYLSGEGGADWQYEWARRGDYDHHPVSQGSTFSIGNIDFEAFASPGHTPEHVSYLITDRGGGANEPMGICSGDFVFVGDLGRPDLLETAAGEAGARDPAARALFQSVQRFLKLPEYLQLWPGHGAGSACGKALGAVPESTVGYEKRFNVAILAADRGESEFVDSILDGQPEPPLYFGRMKVENRTGPAILDGLPNPGRIDAQALAAKAEAEGAVILDTRRDRNAFMSGHLSKSLFAPFGNTLPTVAGSYVQPDENIYLVVEREADVPELVLNLIRIGLDRIEGFALIADLAQMGSLDTIKTIRTTDLEEERPGISILDVRRAAEHAASSIPGSLNIAHTRLGDRLDELPASATLLVHCRSGARSAVATAYLRKVGFDAVYVDGLFSDWSVHREPVGS